MARLACWAAGSDGDIGKYERALAGISLPRPFAFTHFARWICSCNHLFSVNNKKLQKTNAIVLGLLLCAFWAIPVSAQSETKPDNTKVNKRDRNPGEVTADQQLMNPADRALTAKIRKSIMADKTLSTYAHNVKIISQNGTVTLKGPVHSEGEVKVVMSKAIDATGSPDKVVNEMSVKP